MTALNPTRMELRSGAVVGAHLLPPQARPAFEEGVRLYFQRWTALTLAVENQWGGASSAEKANWLLQETIQWFYKNKGAQKLGKADVYQPCRHRHLMLPSAAQC